jgi:hypothetical protein
MTTPPRRVPLLRRLARRLPPLVARRLPILPLAAALACGDASPVAPHAPRVAADAPLAASYPGTTNTEFSGVQTQSEGMGLSIKFNYTGTVTPAFTVGTGPNVLATQVRSAPATKQPAGYWTAHVGGLPSGKRYYFRLDNLKSTWYDSAKTLRRDVTLDVDSAYVYYDGDPGPGCGEVHVRPVMIGRTGVEFSENAELHFWRPVLPEHCMYSGSWYHFGNSPNAKQTYHNFPGTSARLGFLLYERDNAAFCGGEWTADCGSRNTTGHDLDEWDVTQEGTHHFKQTTMAIRSPT